MLLHALFRLWWKAYVKRQNENKKITSQLMNELRISRRTERFCVLNCCNWFQLQIRRDTTNSKHNKTNYGQSLLLLFISFKPFGSLAYIHLKHELVTIGTEMEDGQLHILRT